MLCPCGSTLDYQDCCRPVIKGERAADTAEQLMRARYTAYTQVEVDFLLSSLHPDQRAENDAESIREWAEKSTWHGLEIISTEIGSEIGTEAGHQIDTVEFAASYTLAEETKRHHEIAEFELIEGNWYFKEGRVGVAKPIVREGPRIGRNDPCPCGSGRKFKRCCGG